MNKELVFVPHYTQHKERYGLYWYFVSFKERLKLAEKEEGFDGQESARVCDFILTGKDQN